MNTSINIKAPSLSLFLLTIWAYLVVFPADSHTEEKLKIVTTTGMIADITKEVVGDKGEVTALMGPGIDPHLYKPTRSDIASLIKADILFYNGLLLEGKMTDALIRVATSGKPVYAVTELLDEKYLLEPKEFQGHFDPHVWMDPLAWSKAVEAVRDEVIKFDSKNSAHYTAKASAYIEKLNALNSYAQKVLASVPASSRVLVTAHDAFNYFGRRYGFEVVGIQGISTESEAGVKDIERLVTLLVERKVKAVFIETTVSERNVRALIEGASARKHTVIIGGSLFSDAMGADGSYEGTYLGMIDHNVTTIAKALGGTTPPGGMQAKLKSQ